MKDRNDIYTGDNYLDDDSLDTQASVLVMAANILRKLKVAERKNDEYIERIAELEETVTELQEKLRSLSGEFKVQSLESSVQSCRQNEKPLTVDLGPLTAPEVPLTQEKQKVVALMGSLLEKLERADLVRVDVAEDAMTRVFMIMLTHSFDDAQIYQQQRLFHHELLYNRGKVRYRSDSRSKDDVSVIPVLRCMGYMISCGILCDRQNDIAQAVASACRVFDTAKIDNLRTYVNAGKVSRSAQRSRCRYCGLVDAAWEVYLGAMPEAL